MLAATTAKDAMGAPPHSRNHLAPTAGETPALRAASSLEHPSAIACQNGRRSDRCSTGGRPGDLIFTRPIRTFLESIAISYWEALRRSVEFTQYTSIAFGKRCKEMGVRPSMGTVGNAYDNAMAERVLASLECELIERRSFKTKTEARLAVFTWIEAWYNPRRRHSAHGRISPVNFEGCTPTSYTNHRAFNTGCPPPGLCVAGATPAVYNPALMLRET